MFILAPLAQLLSGSTEKTVCHRNEISITYNFLCFQKLVVKPDQLIKRRGKLGLIKAGTDLAGVKDWLTNKLGKEFKV